MIQARPPLFTQQRAEGFGPGATRSRRPLSLRGTPSGNRHPASGEEDRTADRPTRTGRYPALRPG